MASTSHALVPNASRTALLVADGRLPVVHLETRHQFEALEQLKRAFRIRAAFLRVAARVRRADEVDLLNEFDAPPAEWGPEPPATWLPLEDADPGRIAPVEFGDAVARWLEEQRGGPIPAQRPPWARPGWLGQAAAWVADEAGAGGEPRLVRQWPLSAVYRFEDAAGSGVYLKAVFSLFGAEPAVTEALARAHPGAVPDVIAIDVERGWMLMRELEGKSARGAAARNGVRAAARIQRAWQAREGELRSLGCRRRGLEEVAVEMPGLAKFCNRLAAFGIAESIVHGDLHHGNMIVSGKRVAVIDWSDAAIGHPFLDLAPVLWIGEKQRDALIAAYVQEWADLAPADDLREAAAIGEAIGCVYQAISYRAINEAFEPADRWLFADSYDEWLERADRLASSLPAY